MELVLGTRSPVGGEQCKTYEDDGRKGHAFEFDVELVAGLDLGEGVWRLGLDGFDEAFCPLWEAWEVEELWGWGLC